MSEAIKLFSDSIVNRDQLKFLKDLLSPYPVYGFVFLRIYKNNTMNIVSSQTEAELSDFIKNLTVKKYILNKNTISNYAVVTDEFSLVKDKKTFLILERQVFDFKFSMVYYLDKNIYEVLNPEHLAKFQQMLGSFNKLAYSMLRWNKVVPFENLAGGLDVNEKKSIPMHKINYTLKNKFDISDNEFEYLKLIITGCTSKEIALHMNKSHRSVENLIYRLQRKLSIPTKEQLENFARIVLCEFTPNET